MTLIFSLFFWILLSKEILSLFFSRFLLLVWGRSLPPWGGPVKLLLRNFIRLSAARAIGIIVLVTFRVQHRERGLNFFLFHREGSMAAETAYIDLHDPLLS